MYGTCVNETKLSDSFVGMDVLVLITLSRTHI
jgi:hypothetical protein